MVVETVMKKVLRIGSIKVYPEKQVNVYICIKGNKDRLSFTGVIGPKANGDALGGCGQIDMEFAHRNPEHNDKRYDSPIKPSEIIFAPGWDAEKWFDLLELWRRWHLNDMRAECEHQRKRGETWSTHPSAVCPDCSYKLGHSWLKEEVPQDVINIIESVPETDVTPAWV